MTNSDSKHQPMIDELLNRGWLQSLEWFESIDSTNTAARRLLEQPGVRLPALLVADRQTAGRGRSDHRWWSPDGCLMLTLVIDSDLMPAMTHGWSQLALVCGVAVADTVAAIVGEIDCQLKWPNDVYVRGRKIAGILIETVRLPARTPANGWLIGIGLNVNMDWSAAPEELAARATCLSRETQCGYDPEEVLMELVEQLECWLVGWRNGSLHWLNGWRERCLLTGKIIQVRLAHSPSDVSQPAMLLGRCEGVDTQGRLLVRQEQGVQSLSVGEVIHWQS